MALGSIKLQGSLTVEDSGGGGNQFDQYRLTPQDLVGGGVYKDTGRQSSGPADMMDSFVGAPARAAVQEAQNGNLSWDAVKKIFHQIGSDPQTAPTGYDIASKVTDNPYIGTMLATAVDFGAQMPGVQHLTPGVIGEIKGVKNLAPGLVDALEAFAERGKSSPSLETKIAQMHGQAGQIKDAVPELLGRAEDDLFGGKPKRRSAIKSEEPPRDQTEFWHDVNDHSFTDEAKKSMDSLVARFGEDSPQVIKALEKSNAGPDHMPYMVDPMKKLMGIPNFSAKPTGQIGTPGISGHRTNPDPFMWVDDKWKAGKQLLRRHKSMGMPAEIHTSSDLIGKDDYIKEIPKGSTVNFYFGPHDKTLHRQQNPINPSNSRLESAASKIEQAGHKVNRVYPEGDNFTPLKPDNYAHGGTVPGYAHGGITSLPAHVPMISQDEAQKLTSGVPDGFTIETQSQDSPPPGFELQEDKYGGIGGMAATAGLGALSGATLGASNVALTKSGLLDPETLKSLQEENPVSNFVGETAGLFAPTGVAGAIGKAGKATYTGLKALGAMRAAEEAGAAAKLLGITGYIAAHAAGSAVEGAAYAGTANTLNEYALGDPDLNAEKILSNYGQGALFGGVLGGALKAAHLGLPPSVKAGKDALTGFKNIVAGKGTGDESLISRALDAMTPEGSVVADGWRNRAINLDKNQLDEMVQKTTSSLNTVKNNFQTAVKTLNSDIRPEETKALIDTADPKKVSFAVSDVLNDIRSVKADMVKNIGIYDQNAAAKLDRWELQITNNLADPSPGKTFELLKDVKQGIGGWGHGSTKDPKFADTKDALKGLSSRIGETLKNPEIFGAVGSSYAGHDEMLSKIYNFLPPDGSRLGKTAKEFKNAFLDASGGFSPKKMKTFLKLGDSPEGQRSRDLLDMWFAAQQDLPGHIEKTYANVPNEMWGDKKLSGLYESLGNTRESVQKNLTDYGEALAHSKGKNLGLKEMGLAGGSLLGFAAGHPLLGAISAIGMGIDAASRPLEYINKLAEVERILGKASDTIQKGAKAIFVPTLKGIGRAKGTLIRDVLIPTPEQFKKDKDDLSQNVNNPEMMIDKLHSATEHLHSVAPQVTAMVQQGLIRGSQFLASKLPGQSQNSGNPFQAEYEPSKTELAQFGRYKQLVDDPQIALDQIKQGAVGPETIETLTAVYPKLYEHMKQEVLQAANDAMAKKQTIPFSTKQQVSFFLGQPLDQALSQQSVMTNQQIFAQATQQQAMNNTPKSSGKKGPTLAERTKVNQGATTPS